MTESDERQMVEARGRLLGVAAVDLFVPIFTVVFGEAQVGGACALASFYRLSEEHYGLPPDESKLRERLAKEIGGVLRGVRADCLPGNQCPGRERLFHRGDPSAIPGPCRIRSNGGVVAIGVVRGGAHPRSSSSAAFPNPFRCRFLGHKLSLASGVQIV
jgi:hypothetical protein